MFDTLLVFGLVGGTIGGMVGGIVMGVIDNFSDIRLIDTFRWSWEQSKRGLVRGLFVGLIGAPIAGAFLGMLYASSGSRPIDELNDIYYNATQMLSGGLVGGLLIGLFYFAPIFTLLGGLFGGLYEGIRSQAINEDASSRGMLNKKLRSSLLVFLFYGPVGGTVIGIIAGTFFILLPIVVGLILTWGVPNEEFSVYTYPPGDLGLSEKLITVLIVGFLLVPAGLLSGLLIGIVSGLLGGLKSGGFSAIRHYLLRFIISRHNILPKDLIAFLDDCTDLIFLRRVGGGYIFIHRLLMEHFAAMRREERE